MENGTRVRGETKITASKDKIKELFLDPAGRRAFAANACEPSRAPT